MKHGAPNSTQHVFDAHHRQRAFRDDDGQFPQTRSESSGKPVSVDPVLIRLRERFLIATVDKPAWRVVLPYGHKTCFERVDELRPVRPALPLGAHGLERRVPFHDHHAGVVEEDLVL
jgi:hypothetical protein